MIEMYGFSCILLFSQMIRCDGDVNLVREEFCEHLWYSTFLRVWKDTEPAQKLDIFVFLFQNIQKTDAAHVNNIFRRSIQLKIMKSIVFEMFLKNKLENRKDKSQFYICYRTLDSLRFKRISMASRIGFCWQCLMSSELKIFSFLLEHSTSSRIAFGSISAYSKKWSDPWRWWKLYRVSRCPIQTLYSGCNEYLIQIWTTKCRRFNDFAWNPDLIHNSRRSELKLA